jgi:hypothetical protein
LVCRTVKVFFIVFSLFPSLERMISSKPQTS